MQDKALVPDVIEHNASISRRRESLLPANLYKFLDQHVSSANEASETLFSDATISNRKTPLSVGSVQYPRQHVPVTQKTRQTPVQVPQPLVTDAASSKRNSPLPVGLVQYPQQHVVAAKKVLQTPFTEEEPQELQRKVRKLQHDIMVMDRDRRSVFQQLLHCSHSHGEQSERAIVKTSSQTHEESNKEGNK